MPSDQTVKKGSLSKRAANRLAKFRQKIDVERAKKRAPKEIDPIKLAKEAAAQSIRVGKRTVKKGGPAAEAAMERIEAIEKVTGALDGKAPAVVTKDDIERTPPNLRKWAKAQDVIFEPNPGPQTEFLAATEKEVLYGGARGGGKSIALLVDPLRYCNNRNHSALILRRTMPELRDLIWKSQEWYPRAFPGAKWRENDKLWVFPSGARIEFGYAETEADLMRYQGRAYSWIGIDEVGQFPDRAAITKLKGSLRTTDPTLPTFLRMTANPGGPGQLWLREDFVEPAPPNTTFTVPVTVQTPYGPITTHVTRRFIPATIYDNPHLLHDTSYLSMLASLPESLRKQWLEGDWYADESRAFPDFDPRLHVVDPFPVPTSWPRFRACDFGFSSPACVLWFAVDYDGNLWVYDELYVKGVPADEFARIVLQRDGGAKMTAQILDASVWQRRGDIGPSIAEIMNLRGCRWRPSDRSPRSRVNGKMEIHRRLALRRQADNTEAPSLRIFNTCRNVIRQMQTLPLDQSNPEDVDTKAEDHAYDALRYGVMSRPLNPSLIAAWNSATTAGAFKPVDSTFGY